MVPRTNEYNLLQTLGQALSLLQEENLLKEGSRNVLNKSAAHLEKTGPIATAEHLGKKTFTVILVHL